MSLEIIETPFRVSLVGTRGKVENNNFGEAGMKLMDAMWDEVDRLSLPHAGINHWVYLPNSEMFTGVELKTPAVEIGSLERLDVEVNRYIKHVHRGDYSKLPETWQTLFAQIDEAGEKPTSPSLEIYGHHCEKPDDLETTVIIGVKKKA